MNKPEKTVILLILLLCTAFSSAYSESSVTAIPDTLITQEAYTVGTHILYGRYEQDDDLSNGKEPLEWIILDRTGNRALIIANNIIDIGWNFKYGIQGDVQTYRWSNSTLRRWLNKDFINIAFSGDEQKGIVCSLVKAEKNPFNGYAVGQDTEDQVFILSYKEALMYFPNDKDRISDVTNAIMRNPYSAIYTMNTEKLVNENNKPKPNDFAWALRAPGKASWPVIDKNGKLKRAIGNTYVSLRPVCVIDLEKTVNILIKPIPKPISMPEISVGNMINFGSYGQLGGKTDGPNPIEWVVIAREQNRVLLLSMNILYSLAYSDTAQSRWEKSNIRSWLNSAFLSNAFNDQEKLSIAIRTVLAERDGTGRSPHEKIFLLSRTEVEKYITNSYQCIATIHRSSQNEISDISSQSAPCSWWLRSSLPWASDVDYVDTTGAIKSIDIAKSTVVYGIRPALWLNLDVFEQVERSVTK